MAARFWVGGSGNWNLTSTTNWSATSGGAGGASVPTVADDVTFNVNSNVGTGAFTVTITASLISIRSLTISGLDGAMTLTTASTAELRVDFNISLPATNLVTTGNVQLYTSIVSSATTVRTLTMGGASYPNLTYRVLKSAAASGDSVINLNSILSCKSINIQGEGGTAAAIKLTFNTNNNAVTATDFTMATSTVNAGTSTFTLGNRFANNSNGIFNGTSATVSIGDNTSANSFIQFDLYSSAGTCTIGTLNIKPHSGSTIRTERTHTITTCNITWAATTLATAYVEGIAGTTSTFNTLNVTGFSKGIRAFLRSGTDGTRWTISAPTARTLTNAEFQDISASQAWTGTYIGDAGNNLNITFTTATSRSAISAGNWSDTAIWSAGNAPLPQDTAVVNGSSGSGTITMDVRNACKALNCTGYTGTLAIGSVQSAIYGDLILGSGMTVTGSNLFLKLRGSGAIGITTNGTYFNSGLWFNCPSSAQTVTLNDNLRAREINVAISTLTAGIYNVTCVNSFYTSTGSTINMGSGVFEFGSTAQLRYATINKQTANILANSTGFTFGAGQSYNKITKTSSGTGTMEFSLPAGSASVTEISNVGDTSSTQKIQNNSSAALDVGAFTVNGTSSKTVTVIGNFNYTGASFVECRYLTVLNSTVTPVATWTAINSTDSGGNSGWTFVTEGSNGLLFGSNF
jgi:hypothetical protein